MFDPTEFNPTNRFTGLAQTYALHRPGYPDEALDFIVSTCKLGHNSRVADIGCGTGISSRAFAICGMNVIGIEPNADMRKKAQEEILPAPYTTPQYREGSAENTGLESESVDAVLAAQAFHWFRPNETLQEFHRILKPDGWCILMWNERDELDDFTKTYGDFLRTLPDTAKVEQSRAGAGNALLDSSLFSNTERVDFHHRQSLNVNGLLGRAFSASYVPKDLASVAHITEELQRLFADFEQDGVVEMCYETSVYLGQRTPSRR